MPCLKKNDLNTRSYIWQPNRLLVYQIEYKKSEISSIVE